MSPTQMSASSLALSIPRRSHATRAGLGFGRSTIKAVL